MTQLLIARKSRLRWISRRLAQISTSAMSTMAAGLWRLHMTGFIRHVASPVDSQEECVTCG